ncbi:hypothetical protein EROP_15350 [Erysipelotrichaceae bacterium OPF54]|uniref:anthrax toxin lethal factor-related metalloendopeptidase n=1 Tax=uncultured Dubosiella sp. TaxID=1937011 RepID=UPI002089732A|nr:hypothetical protein [uncultured Dubosiella sp.]GJM57842.1 hypothetical protein EROP_15350 [Erysipelotrichaceae bacterium OPF54]
MKKLFRSLSLCVVYAMVCYLVLTLLQELCVHSTWTVNEIRVLAVAAELLDFPYKWILSAAAGLWAGLSHLFERHGFIRFLIGAGMTAGAVYWFGPSLYRTVYDSVENQKIAAAQQQAQESLAAMEAQIFEFEGLPPVRFVCDEEVSYEYVQHFAAALQERIPAYLFEKCTSIIVMDDTYFSQEDPARASDNVVGFASSSDMAVRLLRNDISEPYIDLAMPERVMMPDDYYANTLAHELGHLEDYQTAYGQEFLSDTPSFHSLYESEGGNLNEYGSTSSAEYFAEAVKYYVRYPQDLADKAPMTYSYYERLFEGRNG